MTTYVMRLNIYIYKIALALGAKVWSPLNTFYSTKRVKTSDSPDLGKFAKAYHIKYQI